MKQEHQVECLLFLTVLLACSWFFSVGSWNQNARYDAIFAFWENPPETRYTFIIDQYVPIPEYGVNTGDWAFCSGHYYSNKSPGTTLLGTLAYGPLYLLERCFIHQAFTPALDFLNAWILNILLSGLPLAFGIVCFRRILLRSGCSQGRAALFSLLMVFGTGLWPYATQMWGLPATGAFLILSYYFFLCDTKYAPYVSGFFFGTAVLFDYSAAMLIPAVGIALLMHTLPHKKVLLLRFIAGGIPLALLYLWYNKMCFGGILQFAFMHNNPEFVTAERAGGVAALPNPHILLELLIGQYRGILPAMPFLLFAFPGFHYLWKSGREKKRLALFLAGCIVSLLLMNASFNGWHGGWAILPRYLIPSFPIWCLLTSFSPLKKPSARAVFAVLAILSVCNMTAVTANTPITWGVHANPVYGVAYKSLTLPHLDFEMELLKLHLFHPEKEKIIYESMTSFGERAGLPRYGSTVLLMLLLLAFSAKLLLSAPAKEMLKQDMAYWKERCCGRTFRLDLFSVLTILAVLLLFLLPGSIPFIHEGPQLIQAAFQNNANNTFTFSDPGSFAIILYQLLLMITPDNLYLLVTLKTALSLLSVILFFMHLHKKHKDYDWRIPLLFLLISPYFYLHARSLGDSAFLISVSALALYFLCRYSETESLRYGLGVIICLFAGLMIHIACLPLAGAFAVYLLLIRRDLLRKHGVMPGLFAILSCVFLWFHRVASSGTQHTVLPVGEWFLNPFRSMSFEGFFSYFFPEAAELYPALVLPGRILAFLSLLCFLLFFLAGTVGILRRHIRQPDPVSETGLCSLAAILLHTLLFPFLIPHVQTQYATVLMIPCACIAGYGAQGFLKHKIASALPMLYLCTMLSGVFCFIIMIERNGGTPGPHYGATLKNQMEVVRTIQYESRHYKNVDLEIQTMNQTLFPQGIHFLFEFLMKTDPPLKKDAVKTNDELPAVIRYSGPPYSGFIRAYFPRQGGKQ